MSHPEIVTHYKAGIPFRFLGLLRLLFSDFEEELRTKGYQLPRVYLLVVCGTETAAKAVDNLGPLGGRSREYSRFDTVFGHVFGPGVSASPQLPENVRELAALLPEGERAVGKKFRQGVRFFHDKYGQRYWRDAEANIDSDSESEWGYKGGGWTIVTFENCPNNSLPVIWYPHTASALNEIVPLFPRVDSRLSHVGTTSELEDCMEVVRRDADGYLRQFLASIYKGLI